MKWVLILLIFKDASVSEFSVQSAAFPSKAACESKQREIDRSRPMNLPFPTVLTCARIDMPGVPI